MPSCRELLNNSENIGWHLQIKAHPKTSLMQKHHISYNHWHNRLICSSAQTTNNSRSNKARVARHQCLPDIRKYANQAADKDGRTSPQDIAERNDDKIGISESNGCSPKQHVDFRKSLVECLDKDWCQRWDRKWC
jgi:hypothetical protein